MQYIVNPPKNLFWFFPVAFILLSFVYLAYPGGFSPDSLMIYMEATGQAALTDEKPIFGILIARISIDLVGPGGLIVVNSLVYLCGVFLIAKALFQNLFFRLLSSLSLIIYPPLLFIVLTNWIDSIELSALAMTLGFICMYIFHNKHVSYLWLALFFSVWASLARYNAPSTIFFLQLFVGYLLSKRYIPKQRVTFFAITVGLVFFCASLLVGYALIRLSHVQHTNIIGRTYMYDLASISLGENKNFIPKAAIKPPYDNLSEKEFLAVLKAHYMPTHNWHIWELIDKDSDMKYEKFAIVTSLKHLDHLLHERYITNVALLTSPEVSFNMHVPHYLFRYLKLRKARKKFVDYARQLRRTPLFQAIWYVLFSVLVLIACFLLTFFQQAAINGVIWERGVLILLSLSSLFTWLPLVPMITTAEFRYLIPCVFFSMVMVLVIVRILLKRRSRHHGIIKHDPSILLDRSPSK